MFGPSGGRPAGEPSVCDEAVVALTRAANLEVMRRSLGGGGAPPSGKASPSGEAPPSGGAPPSARLALPLMKRTLMNVFGAL